MMPGLVGPILGPVLGGVLVTQASWHWIFLINIPIGVAGLCYARKYMPNFTTPRRSFDMGGFFLFGVSLVDVLHRYGVILVRGSSQPGWHY